LEQGPPDRRLLDVDASNIRFTSGTTANFKGVVLSHGGIGERIAAANRALRISERDTVFFGLQMAHHFAVSVMLHLSVGATIVTGGVFLADSMVRQIRRHRATIIYTTPVSYRMMADAPNADRSALADVRLAISTAMALPASVAGAFEERFGRPLSQALGIIEVGMPIMNLPGPDFAPGALGRLIEGFEAQVIDENGRPLSHDAPVGAAGGSVGPDPVGQLLLKGPGMLAAYYAPWRSRDKLLHDGWFASGDLVRRDRDGNFFIVGRAKDVINVGGTKVFPYEIEEVLVACEAVAEAVVIAAPDDVLGEVPMASVVLRPGASATSQALIEHCRRSLSPFKLPRHVQIVAQLPRTHSGKIARTRLATP
ncbi:MAG: long-chain fatty acid--CoA ligase, partial [Planctomycetes bacterium]|nr:long-chain fatty acid--CoA ligase [Planctomycetota bacterium]